MEIYQVRSLEVRRCGGVLEDWSWIGKIMDMTVIILLKDDVRRIETIILQGFLEFIIQNLKVEIPIQPIIHPNSRTNSLSSHMAPHSPPNLRVPSTSLSQSPLPALFHVHLHSSDPRQLIFSLIRPYYLFPILYSVIIVGISIVQVSFAISSRKKRAFGLHHGLHTSFHQVEMDGICGERILLRTLVTWTVFSAFPEVIRCWSYWILVGGSLKWPLSMVLGSAENSLQWRFDMAEGPTPVSLAIDSSGRPVLSKERMMLYWTRKRDLTILVAENEEVCELF